MEATGYLIGGGRRSSFHSDTAFLFLPSMTQRGPGTRLSYQVAPRRPMQPPVGRCNRCSLLSTLQRDGACAAASQASLTGNVTANCQAKAFPPNSVRLHRVARSDLSHHCCAASEIAPSSGAPIVCVPPPLPRTSGTGRPAGPRPPRLRPPTPDLGRRLDLGRHCLGMHSARHRHRSIPGGPRPRVSQ
jgi:hypothetical protein